MAYSEKIKEKALQEYIKGKSFNAISRMKGMPSAKGLTKWCDKYNWKEIKSKSIKKVHKKFTKSSQKKEIKIIDDAAEEIIKEKEKTEVKREEIITPTVENTLKEMSIIGCSDITDFLEVKKIDRIIDGKNYPVPTVVFKPSNEWPEEKRRAVQSVKLTKKGLELKMHGKNQQITNMAKYNGLLNDTIDLQGQFNKEIRYIFEVKEEDTPEVIEKKNKLKEKIITIKKDDYKIEDLVDNLRKGNGINE